MSETITIRPTAARTPVRRLATYRASDLREGDRIRHYGRTYRLAGTRTVTYYDRGLAITRIGLDLDDPKPPAQATWGMTPRQAHILTMWTRPDETIDIEEDHQ